MPSNVSHGGMPALSDATRLADRRAALFRETPLETLERWVLGAAWALQPSRIGGLPGLARLWLTDLVVRRDGLPDPNAALTAPSGLCGIVHDFSAPNLLEAYRRGLFTFAHFGALKWYSPPERCVLFFNEFHIGKTIRRHLRQGRYRVTFDRDFEGVIKACAGRRDGKWHVTWITPRIMRAYAELYDAGHVHSFEVWNGDDKLVGGGYGVAIGDVFFTESQFSLERDSSKIGFTVLNWHLARWGFVLNDGKDPTPTILAMGFRAIPRADFLAQVERGTGGLGNAGRWQVETDLTAIAAWQLKDTQPVREPEPQGA
ncbi:MAG TPA: leucyl/phenylalanyl-tRNA--protein transferase [Xanthobacteraceae bacterium]|nr:leucyl/phenylalanyl-tRNA--protein transferase [Xanthobacteraceae bacterium]